MISGSYKGLINLVDSTLPLSGQSVTLVDLQDGLGNDVGIQINKDNNDVTVKSGFIVSGSTDLQDNLEVSGSVDISGSLRVHGDKEITGSVDILGDLTVTGDISAETGSFDTIHTRVLHVTTETASVIFSSGSNKLGDEETDRQDLIGQVIVSGTLGVEGNSAFTGSLTVSNEISSSTVNGIGNVTTYSSSVDDRLTQLEVSSGSQDSQLSNLENFTASQEIINSGINSFTQSIDSRFNSYTSSTDNRLDQLEADTGSQDQRLDLLEAFTGSQETINGFYNQHTSSLNAFSASQLTINSGYNSYTQSINTEQTQQNSRLNNLELYTSSLNLNFVTSASFQAYTASQETINGFYNSFTASNGNTSLNTFTSSADSRLNNLELATGSYATTGSNTFNGNQDFSGSVRGEVSSLTISSETASIDCSTGNFFTLTLPSGSTHINATNINGGETITLELTQPSNGDYGTITTDSTIIFPEFNQPQTTNATSSIDVMTFVSFDTTRLLGVMQNNFQ